MKVIKVKILGEVVLLLIFTTNYFFQAFVKYFCRLACQSMFVMCKFKFFLLCRQCKTVRKIIKTGHVFSQNGLLLVANFLD